MLCGVSKSKSCHLTSAQSDGSHGFGLNLLWISIDTLSVFHQVKFFCDHGLAGKNNPLPQLNYLVSDLLIRRPIFQMLKGQCAVLEITSFSKWQARLAGWQWSWGYKASIKDDSRWIKSEGLMSCELWCRDGVIGRGSSSCATCDVLRRSAILREPETKEMKQSAANTAGDYQ